MSTPGALSAFAGALVQNFLTGAPATPPAALYAALGNIVAGAFVEIAATDYARQLYVPTVSQAGVMSNQGGITFGPNAVVAWGSVDAVALYDAQAAGDLIWVGALAGISRVGIGDTVSILAGALLTAQSAAS